MTDKIIDYRDLIARSTAGFVGRGWVRDAVDGFLRADGPRSFLLLGEPGSGKTALMADQVRRNGYPHHFIGKGSQIGLAASLDWRNPVRFAESIGYQLLRDYGGWVMDWESWGISVSQEVRDLDGLLVGAELGSFLAAPRPADRPVLTVEQEVARFGPAARMVGVYIEQFVMDVEQVVRQLLTAPLGAIARRWPDRQVVLVVDGLDEAEGYSDPQRNILRVLPDGDLPVNVRILLSSRPGEHLTPGFLSQVETFWLSENEQGEQDPRAIKDARAFVAKLAQEGQVGRMLAGRKIEPGTLGERVAGASKGNFLYLAHYAQGLRDGDESLLDLEALPNGLYGIYRDFLAKIKERRADVSWDRAYKPVLGTLAAAWEPLTRAQIAALSGVKPGTVGTILVRLKQFLDVSGEGAGRRYAPYHRSFGEYLISEENEDYIDGQEAHARIVAHYLPAGADLWADVDWEPFDDYGFRHLVSHLGALLGLSQTARERERRAKELYAAVLDERFQMAQRAHLGDALTTLTDLRATLGIALPRGDLLPALRCVAAYRDVAQGKVIVAETGARESSAQAVFEAVDAGDFALAAKRAEVYGAVPEWARVLHLYLAWEAANVGDLISTRKALATAERLPAAAVGWLCDALVAHAARALARTVGGGRDASAWFAELAPGTDAYWGLRPYDVAQPPDPQERQDLLDTLNDRLAELGRLVDEGDVEAVAMVPFVDEEIVSDRAARLKDLLVQLAADPAGQDAVDWALEPVLTNPYPRYRDLALEALGIACLAVPDLSWVRLRLRRILHTALDLEGVTFTFELPSILLAEAQRRQRSAPELVAYVDQALASDDRWGSSVRAGSARATALFHQGSQAEAWDQLQEAARRPGGYAGYASVTLLALANRCHEFGQPGRASAPAWGAYGDTSLLDEAMNLAHRVRDTRFREERVELVRTYRDSWWGRDVPNVETMLADLAAMPDLDTRMAYVDHVSARWAWPPDGPNWEGLQALLPIALVDASTLDVVLGRLFGLRVRQFSDDELDQAIRICTTYLTTGRPWELGARSQV